MRNPYVMETSNKKYHVGNGNSGSINVAIRYSKEKMDSVRRDRFSYYNVFEWKFLEIKDNGMLVEIPYDEQ